MSGSDSDSASNLLRARLEYFEDPAIFCELSDEVPLTDPAPIAHHDCETLSEHSDEVTLPATAVTDEEITPSLPNRVHSRAEHPSGTKPADAGVGMTRRGSFGGRRELFPSSDNVMAPGHAISDNACGATGATDRADAAVIHLSNPEDGDNLPMAIAASPPGQERTQPWSPTRSPTEAQARKSSADDVMPLTANGSLPRDGSQSQAVRTVSTASEKTLLRFAIFFCTHNNLFLQSTDTTPTSLTTVDYAHALNCTREFLFSDDDGKVLPCNFSDWTEDTLLRLRQYLFEYASRYNQSPSGSDVVPRAMNSYALRLSRAFREMWGYDICITAGPIFACPRDGLMASFTKQYSRDTYTPTKQPYILSRADVLKLYSSDLLSMDHARGMQRRILFHFALMTGLPADALVKLKLDQVSRIAADGEYAWRLTNASRAGRSGKGIECSKPFGITIFNDVFYNGLINVYDDLEQYMSLRTSLGGTCDRLLAAVLHPAEPLHSTFFKAQALGRGLANQLISQTFDQVGINIAGENGNSSLVIRATIATTLIDDGEHSDSIVLHTSRRKVNALQSYQSLREKQAQISAHSPSTPEPGTPEPIAPNPISQPSVAKRPRTSEQREISISVNGDHIEIFPSQQATAGGEAGDGMVLTAGQSSGSNCSQQTGSFCSPSAKRQRISDIRGGISINVGRGGIKISSSQAISGGENQAVSTTHPLSVNICLKNYAGANGNATVDEGAGEGIGGSDTPEEPKIAFSYFSPPT